MTLTHETRRQTGRVKPAVVTDGVLVNVTLPPELFDRPPNIPLIHQVVVAQQAAARQGTHSTKRRGEVRGGGRKPHKQKGTGRARQGSTRAPQYVGGGVVHGPKPRDYHQRTPKKMKAGALLGALSARARDGRIHVMGSFGLDNGPYTKQARHALRVVGDIDLTRFLVVLTGDDFDLGMSFRNVPNVHLLNVDQLNTRDVLLSDEVVFTLEAYDWFVASRLGGPDGQVSDDLADGNVESLKAAENGHTVPVDGDDTTSVASPDVTSDAARNGPDKTSHQGQLLQRAHEVAMRMGTGTSYKSSDPTIDGWSVSSKDLEYVAIERHADYVFVTWPSTLTPEDAVKFFSKVAGHAAAVYVESGEDDYLAFEDSKADWKKISKLTDVKYLRADIGSEVLIWEEPLDAKLSDNRFQMFEPRVSSRRLLALIDDTTERDVAGTIVKHFETAEFDLLPLEETA